MIGIKFPTHHYSGKATQEEIMQTQTVIKCITAALISLLISACGGGSSSQLDNVPLSSAKKSSSSRSSGSSATGGNSSTTNSNAISSASSVSSINPTSPQKIGNGSGEDFAEGVIDVGIGSGSLAYGGSTSLNVSVVTNTNELVTTPVEVTFDSTCFSAGDAVFTDANGDEVTSITTTDGEASITYTVTTCSGEDEIQASASLSGTVRMAEATINVEPDTVQTISFVSATPTRISLKGTGGIEASTVKFKLIGGSGSPLQNAEVSMALNTTLGGLCLVNPTNSSSCINTVIGTTDNAGEVSATVQAGVIPTPIRITATAVGTTISTQSSELLVSTGIPDQDSMSISATVLNPECYEIDGPTSIITMRMADAFNNPPPAGTAISFWAEGGRIDSGCSTDESGECSVTWSCQEPRPANGRVTILGYAQGNESFTDLDGDGYYDDADAFPAEFDFAEAFRDINEDGVRDAATEPFIDFDQNQSFTDKNGIYNGVLCKTEGSACTKSGITVRDSVVIVMSSNALIMQRDPATGSEGTYEIWVSDQNGNNAPRGTTLALNTSSLNDASASLVGATSVGNDTEADNPFTLSVNRTSDTDDPSGHLYVIATTPSGATTNLRIDMN